MELLLRTIEKKKPVDFVLCVGDDRSDEVPVACASAGEAGMMRSRVRGVAQVGGQNSRATALSRWVAPRPVLRPIEALP